MGAEMDAVRISNEGKCIVCIEVYVVKLFIAFRLETLHCVAFCCEGVKLVLGWGGGGGGGELKCRRKLRWHLGMLS